MQILSFFITTDLQNQLLMELCRVLVLKNRFLRFFLNIDTNLGQSFRLRRLKSFNKNNEQLWYILIPFILNWFDSSVWFLYDIVFKFKVLKQIGPCKRRFHAFARVLRPEIFLCTAEHKSRESNKCKYLKREFIFRYWWCDGHLKFIFSLRCNICKVLLNLSLFF